MTELDSHEEASSGEIKRREVTELDSHEEASPGEIKRWEVSWTFTRKPAQKR